MLRPLVILALTLLATTACSIPPTGRTEGAGGARPPAVQPRHYDTLVELRDGVIAAGVPCTEYRERFDPVGGNMVGWCMPRNIDELTLLTIYPTEHGAVAAVNQHLRFKRGLRASLEYAGWEPGPEPTAALQGANWVLSTNLENAARIQAHLGATQYTPERPAPAPTLTGDTRDPAHEVPAPGPSASTGRPDECLDDCAVTRARVIADLSRIVCQAWDPAAAARDDLTTRDPYQLDADRILACTAGGTADLTTLGVLHLWDDHNALAVGQPTRRTLEECATGGTTVAGFPEDGSAYAVVGVRTGPEVTDKLLDAGATVLCD